MGSTVAGIATILVLAAWHLRTRRHPNWRHSRDARFYITTGYPFLAVAVYFLAGAASGTDLNWMFGNIWALVSCTSLVYGFQALDTPVDREPPPPTSRVAPATHDRRTAPDGAPRGTR
ncbi:hypothetical protein E4P42_11230 [Mycobacterium sp. PS03-16]|uniref:hypothetical protein n=1 Tax=Mycobacterium sp. PS03-16 TaxID=2559611 RepID=UPI0010737638|nr:hypothetical protein [Mycobacterium sp. PS03-16]TFV58658.1 hypothetical protein E4P42_11230 [Mycobacterium sp. PS03-16]